MRRGGLSLLAFGLAALGLSAAVAVAGPRVRFGDWETIASERYGFLIAYPGSHFVPRDEANENGAVLVSRDGEARLLVATFENEGSMSLDDYRELLLGENYKGADLDFAPQKDKWFILSGTRGDMHFYEKVSFTCGGKLINSWALLYPVSKRPLYDRVVEAVARTYSPGAGRTGACD